MMVSLYLYPMGTGSGQKAVLAIMSDFSGH